MEQTFSTKGICPSQIVVQVEGDTVQKVQFCGGCNGNGKGIAALVQGMKIDEVIRRCEGITCGHKPTSCPAQLAECLKQMK